MQTETLRPNHFANLFGGVDAAEAIRKAEGWNLKSRVCHPLDNPMRGRRNANSDLANFDASIDADETGEEFGEEL
jgi:hypothetical protein